MRVRELLDQKLRLNLFVATVAVGGAKPFAKCAPRLRVAVGKLETGG